MKRARSDSKDCLRETRWTATTIQFFSDAPKSVVAQRQPYSIRWDFAFGLNPSARNPSECAPRSRYLPDYLPEPRNVFSIRVFSASKARLEERSSRTRYSS